MCLIQEKSESITVAAARKINLWTAKAKFIIASCLAKSNLDEIGPGGLSKEGLSKIQTYTFDQILK